MAGAIIRSMTLIQLLADAPVQSIDEAIALMTAIDNLLPDTDGVKWFNRLYLRVTVSVRDAVHTAQFNDPAFLTTLERRLRESILLRVGLRVH